MDDRGRGEEVRLSDETNTLHFSGKTQNKREPRECINDMQTDRQGENSGGEKVRRERRLVSYSRAEQ